MRKNYYLPDHLFPNVIFISVIVIFLLFFSGCGLIDEGKVIVSEKLIPDKEIEKVIETTEKFFNLLAEKDYDNAYMLISSRDKKKASREEFINEFSNVTDIIKYEINWVEIKNNIAIAGIDLIDSYDGQEKILKDLEVSLIKEEDENWKIVFWK